MGMKVGIYTVQKDKSTIVHTPVYYSKLTNMTVLFDEQTKCKLKALSVDIRL